MDPNATLQFVDQFIRDRREGEEVDEACETLSKWIRDGGFEPAWDLHRLGMAYFATWCAMNPIKSPCTCRTNSHWSEKCMRHGARAGNVGGL